MTKRGVRLNPNQYVMLVSNSNEKKTALARFINAHEPLMNITIKKEGIWGVKPRNKEQSFALDLLMDPTVQVVSLVGKAVQEKLCVLLPLV